MGLGLGVTLKEALQLAQQNNCEIMAVKAIEKQSAEELSQVISKQLPMLSFEASYKYQSEVPSVVIPPTTMKLGQNNNYDSAVNLNYLLFNGFGKESQTNIAVLRKEITSLQASKKTKQIAFQVVETWRELQGVVLQKKILARSKDRMSLQHKNLQALVKSGLALEIDELSLALTLKQYDLRQNELTSKQQALADQLNLLIGAEVGMPDEAESLTINNSVKSLIPNNIEDIVILKEQLNVVAQQQSLATSGYWPEIGLIGSYHYGQPGVNSSKDEWMSYYYAGAVASWKFWDWGAKFADRKALSFAEESLNQQLRQLNQQLKVTYNKAKRDSELLIDSWRIQEEAVSIAKKRLSLVQLRNVSGLVSVNDYKQAENDLLESELTKHQLLVKIVLQQTLLDYLSGTKINEWSIQ
jgi:outer membrane protein TolC